MNKQKLLKALRDMQQYHGEECAYFLCLMEEMNQFDEPSTYCRYLTSATHEEEVSEILLHWIQRIEAGDFD